MRGRYRYRAHKQAGGLIGQPLAYARGTYQCPNVACNAKKAGDKITACLSKFQTPGADFRFSGVFWVEGRRFFPE